MSRLIDSDKRGARAVLRTTADAAWSGAVAPAAPSGEDAARVGEGHDPQRWPAADSFGVGADRASLPLTSPDKVRARQAPSPLATVGLAQARATSPGRVALEKIAAAATEPARAAVLARLGQDAPPGWLDGNTTRLLERAAHWVTWSKGALDRLPEGPERGALTAARAAVFDAVARLGAEDFADQLRRAGDLLDGYSALGDPYVVKCVAPEHRERLYGWFARAGLQPALRALGRGHKSIRYFHQSEAYARALAQLGAALTHLPEGSAAALVQRLGQATESELQGTNLSAALQLADLRQEGRALLRDQVASVLGARFALLGAEVQEAIIDTVSACPSAAALPTLQRLLAAAWFTAATPDTQRVLAFCLGYAAHVAERSDHEPQRRLLSNTVEQIISGAIGAGARNMHNEYLYGTASDSGISLNAAMYSLDADLQPDARLRHLALHTLAHEVSHVLSGQGVARSVAYFEEEYRAFSVGFLAEFGRLPSRREGAEHAAYLLSARDGAYAYIAEGLRAAPATYAEHLAALGLDADAAARGSPAALKRAAAAQPSDVPAPQWGWPGYAENLPRPPAATA